MKKKQGVTVRKPLISEKDLGDRISECAKKVGGKKRLAELSGISESMLYRYLNLDSAPTAGPLIRIARSAGVTLDWLMTGEERTLDIELLEVVVEAVDEALAASNKELPAAKRAKIYSLLYEQFRNGGAESVDRATVLKLVDVAA